MVQTSKSVPGSACHADRCMRCHALHGPTREPGDAWLGRRRSQTGNSWPLRTRGPCAGPGAGHEKVCSPVSSFSGAMYFRRLIICCCHDQARPSAGAAGVAEEEGSARVKLELIGCSADACLISSCMKAGAERARSSGTPAGGARGAADGGASGGGASGGGASGGGASGGGARYCVLRTLSEKGSLEGVPRDWAPQPSSHSVLRWFLDGEFDWLAESLRSDMCSCVAQGNRSTCAQGNRSVSFCVNLALY